MKCKLAPGLLCCQEVSRGQRVLKGLIDNTYHTALMRPIESLSTKCQYRTTVGWLQNLLTLRAAIVGPDRSLHEFLNMS